MPTVQKEARVEVSLCTSFPTVSQALAGPIVPVAQMLVRLHAMLTGINVLSIGASAVLAPGHGVQGHVVAPTTEGPELVVFPTCLMSHDAEAVNGTRETWALSIKYLMSCQPQLEPGLRYF